MSNLPATQSQTQEKPAQQFIGQLSSRMDSGDITLPNGITKERFKAVALAACAKNPKLLAPNLRNSLMLACMRAASDGLLPDGREAALVEMGGEITYMPMFGGLLKLIRNSGEVSSIVAEAVYKNDLFEYELGTDPKCKHVPYIDGDRGKIRCYYAAARLKDGTSVVKIMHVDDAAEIMRSSSGYKYAIKTGKSHPWIAWPVAMGIKTVIKQIAKILPRSTELDRVLDHEAEMDRVERVAATAATHALAPPPPEEYARIRRLSVRPDGQVEDYDGCSDAPEPVDGEVEG